MASNKQFGARFCICIPLRSGMLLSSLLTFITALIYVIDRSYYQHYLRRYTGGYCQGTRLIVGAIEFTALFFSFFGILGAWYTKVQYIRAFFGWQVVRLAAWIWILYLDMPLMGQCELWVDNVKLMTQKHGWNALMYEIAMRAGCPRERGAFFVCAIFSLLVLMYLTWATAAYLDILTQAPKHLLRVPKDHSSGSFYSYSTATRSALDKNAAMASPMDIRAGSV